MIEVVEYRAKHLECLGVNPKNVSLDDDTIPGYTIMLEGLPIACGGLRISSGGIAEAWLVTGDGFIENYITACKIIRKKLTQLAEENNIRTLTASYDMDNDTHRKFTHWLGFTEPIGIFYHLGGAFAGKAFMVVMKP